MPDELHGVDAESSAPAEPAATVEDLPTAGVGERVAGLLPTAILVVGFGALAISNWGVARGAAGSVQAIIVITAIAVAWIGLGILLRRFVGNAWVRSGVLSACALVLVALLVVPYFRDEKVVEEFPGIASTEIVGDEAATAPEIPAAATPPAPAPDPAAVTPRPTPTPEPEPEPVPAPEPEPAAATQPVRIASGALTGLGHSASGTAALYRQPDGSFVVGLEGIDIENGPDYFVHVVPGSGRQDPDGGRDLGALRGNQGTQYYAVPAGVDPTGWTVLVWCRTFAVPVAHATPA